MNPRTRPSRKLLAASIGIATVSYMTATASCSSSHAVGNLGGPYTTDDASPTDATGTFNNDVVGNLMRFDASGDDATESGAQDAPADAVQDAVQDAVEEFSHVVGNLIAPPIDP